MRHNKNMKITKLLTASLLMASLCAGFGWAASGFPFSSVSNRFITPNGNNRTVVFNFQNPGYDNVTGKIFDVRGALVADLGSVQGTSLSWDGRSNGRVVTGGVYIYMLQSTAGSYTGTVVVIR